MGKRIYEKGEKEFIVGKRERRDYPIDMRKVIVIRATTLKDVWDQWEGPGA